MSISSVKYTCPRCNYSSHRKTDVSRHLDRKTPCPPTISDITLTSEVIQQVLAKQYLISETITSSEDKIKLPFINQYTITAIVLKYLLITIHRIL